MVQLPESEHDKERIERLRQAMYSRKLSEKLHPRERRAMGEEPSVVGEDWKREEPQMEPMLVAPKNLGIGRTILYWFLGAAVVFFLGAAGFFLYYFTIGGGSLPASPQNISISVSGPPQVAGGEVTELQIAVTNRNKVPLEFAELVISFPPGTRSPTDFKTDEPSLRQPLGTIEPGGVRQGTISAVFAGKDGARENVKVELEYRVTGSNSVYVANTGYALNFTSSPLSISIDAAEEAISGQPVQMSVTVTSNSSAPIRDVLLSAQYPFGFKLTNSTPKASGAGFWTLGDIGPGQKKTVILDGTLTGESGDERVFHFAAGTRSDVSHVKVDTPLSNLTFRSTISQPFLRLSLGINESSSKSVTVTPGEKVNVTVGFQNNLDSAIQNAVIVARMTGVQFDGSTVQSSDGFYRSSDSAMFWDKTTTGGKLSTLAPGDKGSVSFSFVMPNSSELPAGSNPRLDISVNAAGQRVSETGVPQALQSTARATISVASDLEFIAQSLYYSNPFGSTGPMPPKAGSETTYAVVFTVTNTTNKIADGTLTARLPPYIRWIGIYSPASEDVTFNQAEGTVTWRLKDIEPGVGVNGAQPRQAAIAIGFTPSTSQIGQQPVLLQDVTLTGMDALTSLPIKREVEDLTTNLARVPKSAPDMVVAGDPGFTAGNAAVVK